MMKVQPAFLLSVPRKWIYAFAFASIFLIAGFAAAGEAHAQTYYVSSSDPGRSDSGPGTSASAPWATLTKVSSVTFNAGDTILLKKGDTWTGETLFLKGSGTSSNWITLSSYGTGARPRITPYTSEAAIPAADPTNVANNGILYGIRLQNNAGWKIVGIEVAYTKMGIVYTNDNTDNKDGLWIEDCYVHNIAKWPIHPYPSADNRAAELQYAAYSIGIYAHGRHLDSGLYGHLQNITIKNTTVNNTDAPLDVGWADNITIDSITAKDSYREGVQFGHVNYDGAGPFVGSFTNSRILRSGYLYGFAWGSAGLQFNAVHHFTVDNVEIGSTKAPDGPDGVGVDFEGLNTDVTVQNSYIHDNDGDAFMLTRNGFWGRNEVTGMPIENANTSIIGNYIVNNGLKIDPNQPHAAFMVHGWNLGNGGTISGNTIVKASASQALNHIFERTPRLTESMPRDHVYANNIVKLPGGNVIHYAATGFYKTQGAAGWSYLANGSTNAVWQEAPAPNDYDDAGTTQSYGIPYDYAPNANWQYGQGYWKSSTGGMQIGDNWLLPDVGQAAHRVWTSDGIKKIRITGTAKKADVSGGDGVDVKIVKNNDATPLWSGTLAYNDATGLSHDITLTVKSGDKISFIASAKSSATGDKTEWNPVIEELQGPGQSIYTSQVPSNFFSDARYDLGTKFKANVSGTITKVRIYTKDAESGIHTVRIWNAATGAMLLPKAYDWDIPGGTAGWKEFTLPVPLAISADTDYIVSVTNSTDLYYADTQHGFDSPINNGNLITYAASGVSSTTLGTMPSTTYLNSSFFRDIVFVPTPSQTIFTTQTPDYYFSDAQYELGTKFKTSVAGKITKVRIYTNGVETGTHTVRIWNVATGTMILPTAYSWNVPTGSAGWKEFTLPTPQAISANTDYIVAVSNGTDKLYADTQHGFDSPINNGSLVTYTASGVATTALGTMPTSTYLNSNLFRDIVFVAN